MKAGRKRLLFTFTVSVLVLAGLNGAAVAQKFDADRAAGPTRQEAFGAGNPEIGRTMSAPEIAGSPPGSPRRGPDAPVELIYQPEFSKAGVIDKGSKSIRLIGIAATAIDAQCGSAPDAWPCGRMARAALQRFVRRRAVECRLAGKVDETGGVAHCSVGGRDISEWLVSQGWARAAAPEYAEPEKTAREQKRGLWSPVRPGSAGVAPESISELGPTLTDAVVLAMVDISSQSMTLIHRGRILGHWPVSTARDGKATPTGTWTAKWLSRHHRSSRYNNAPMPYSVFYDGDYAVHGTYQTARLGRPASAGCVRLDPEHAAVLFNLVRTEGLSNTLIVIRQ